MGEHKAKPSRQPATFGWLWVVKPKVSERNSIAYGSNLNLLQIRSRCPEAKIVGTDWLNDYQLLFKGSQTGSYLTIEKCKGKQVPVAVFAISKNDETALDRYEGYPNFYYKKEISVKVKNQTLQAFVYIMHEERPLGIPTKSYLQTCKQGYDFFKFDTAYLEQAYQISKEELQ